MADTYHYVTKRAAAFMAANTASPVIEGQAHADGGVSYTLEDGTKYKLDSGDTRSLPKNYYPRWLHDARS